MMIFRRGREGEQLPDFDDFHGHFLFVDRQGNKVFECSRTMLARRLQIGEVVMLDGEPDNSLFDRIMEGIFGKLRKQPELQPA